MGVRLVLLLTNYFLAKSVPDMATLGNGGLSGVAGQGLPGCHVGSRLCMSNVFRARQMAGLEHQNRKGPN